MGRPVEVIKRRRIRPGPRYRDGGANIPKHFRDGQDPEGPLKRRVSNIYETSIRNSSKILMSNGKKG